MGAQVSVLLDKRRSKKGRLYPLKLRVYDEGQTVTFLMFYDMAEEDYERLSAKRLTEGLEKIRDAIRETELKAMDIARKLKPFDFEAFYKSFITGNPHFVQNKKVFSKTKPEVNARQEEVPAEWKRKFSIFDEPYNGPEYISSIYLLIITSLLHQARVGSARSYQTSFASFKDFRGDVKISEVTSRYLKEFEGWMIVEKGNSKTTVGIYARSMRAVVNEAIELKLLARDDYPFGRRRYGIPTGRNIKKRTISQGLRTTRKKNTQKFRTLLRTLIKIYRRKYTLFGVLKIELCSTPYISSSVSIANQKKALSRHSDSAISHAV
jgi:integrase/recombinase XerD